MRGEQKLCEIKFSKVILTAISVLLNKIKELCKVIVSKLSFFKLIKFLLIVVNYLLLIYCFVCGKILIITILLLNLRRFLIAWYFSSGIYKSIKID